jgi:hypothetical protein
MEAIEFRTAQIRADIRNYSGFAKKITKPEDLMANRRRDQKPDANGIDPLAARLDAYVSLKN